jgi:DNA-binding beta-propeller fold protein YncE
VAVVLGDALRRVAVLGGREGMPRSMGSVYGGSVTRFLGGGLRGVASRVIATPGVRSDISGVAVSRDGSTLLVSNCAAFGGSHTIHEFGVADGSRRRVIGGRGDGPLRFKNPYQVWIASDDFVFVVDSDNRRVQVLTPRLDFHGFVSAGQLRDPRGVCANADVVVVSEANAHRISVFNRSDGALLRRIGSRGSGRGQLDYPRGLCFMSHDRHVAVTDNSNNRVSVFSVDGALLRRIGSVGSGRGQLDYPRGLCFMSHDRHVAVTDNSNNRVSVFSVDGAFIRHVGGGILTEPYGVACSACDELVVADKGNNRVALFSASGELVKTMGRGGFTGVAVHGGAVFAQDWDGMQCVVFE